MTRLSGVILSCCTSGTASSNRREAALPHCALSHAHAVSPDEIARPGTTVGTSSCCDARWNPPIEAFADLAPFDMRMLHPGRTLLERLLRVNNFVIDEARRSDHGCPRIGRQFYDI